MDVADVRNGASPHSIDMVLQINPLPVRLDRYAAAALNQTEQALLTAASHGKSTIGQQGLVGQISKLTDRLNRANLPDMTRMLLSRPNIYAGSIDQVLANKPSVQPDDLEGFYYALLRSVDSYARWYFVARILAEVLDRKQIKIDPGDPRWQRLRDQPLQDISIREGETEPSIMALINRLNREGDIPYYVDQYIQRSEIDPSAFTPAIRQAMIDQLIEMQVQFKPRDNLLENESFDEYMALAYNDARRNSQMVDDPIDAARRKGLTSNWNFTVDYFQSADQQSVIGDNILAAGALDYIYTVGERMQVFNVADALIIRWANGILDIPDGQTAAALYRYHKLRGERSTLEERAMLYKRVFNAGEAQLLSGMVINEAFPELWHNLMNEVTDFIQRSDTSVQDSPISRARIHQATRELQYNLTEHMTGMAHLGVKENYAYLQEAMDIIKSPDVIDYFGGRRQGMWNVIERVAKEDLGVSIQTNALRTCAVESNKVFRWIANFDISTVRPDDFSAFLDAGEAWIIAQASLEAPRGMFLRNDLRRQGKFNGNGMLRDNDIFRGNGHKPRYQAAGKEQFDDWDA